MAYIRLPDDSFYPIPEGATAREAYDMAREKYPDAFEPPKPKEKGLGAALKSGYESTLSDVTSGLKGLVSPNEAAIQGLKEQEAQGKKYESQVGLDKLKEAYEKNGILGVPGEVARQIPLALAEQAPNLGLMYGGAKAGSAIGSPFGAPGRVIGAGIGAIAPSLLQQFGGNIQRQAAIQQEAGQPVDVNRGAALGAAVPQTALDVAGTFIPLGGRIVSKVFGPEIGSLLQRGGSKAAEKLAQEHWGKTLAKGLGTGALAEIPTEVAQQMLERAQAGLPLTSPDALKEYGETAYQVSLLSPLGAAGRFSERAGARDQVAQQQREEAEKRAQAQQAAEDQAAQERQAAQQQAELLQAQQQTGNLFGEEQGKAQPLPNAPSTLTVAEREQQTEALKQEQATKRSQLLKQSDVFDLQLKDIEKRRDAAAEAGDHKTFAALDAQSRSLEEAIKKTAGELKQVPAELSPEMEMAQLRGEQKKLIKELQGLTGPSYDPKKAAKLTERLNEIDKKIEEVTPASKQLGLFDEAQMAAERNESLNRQREQRAQEQEDLLSAAKGESKKEVLNAKAIEEYQKSLQDLEDAHAAGADERQIAKLVEAVQVAAKNRGLPSAVPVEESAVKIDRIKRAIQEEQNNYAAATTDEQKATALANLGELQKRLATATVETVQTPEQKQQTAQDNQRLAHDSLADYIDNIKAGETVSPNSADIIAGHYVKNAIDDVNALREKAGQKQLTTDESLKLAFDVRDIVGTTVKNLDSKILERPDESVPTKLEKRIDVIKSKYSKGAPLEVNKITPELKAERSPELMLREELGGNKRDALELAQKKVDEAKANVAQVEAEQKRVATEGRRLAPYYLKSAKDELALANKQLAEVKKAVEEHAPNPKRVAALQAEVAKRKAEDEQIAEQKARQEEADIERYAPSGVNPDQRSLFGARELEPVATVRATPANFMRFVNTQAQKFKAAKEQAEFAIKTAAERATKYREDRARLAAVKAQDIFKQLEDQRAFVQDLLKADVLVSKLRGQATELWQERGRLVKEQKTANKQNKKIIQTAINELDATAKERMEQINALHARANELQNANIDYEQGLLKRLEKAYANTSEGKSKAVIKAAQIKIGKDRAIVEQQLENQIKEKRIAEQKTAEAQAQLPSAKQEIFQTNKIVGGRERVLRKKVVTKIAPKTAAEKRAEQVAKAKEGAQERARDKALEKERVEEGLTQPKEATAKANQKAMRGVETIGNLPPKLERKKPLKLGAAENKKRSLKAKKDLEQEALDAGLSRIDYEFVRQGLEYGFKAREEEAVTNAGVSQEEVQKIVDDTKLPKGLKVIVMKQLTPELESYIVSKNLDPKKVRGGVLQSGAVFVVANNHKDAMDVKKTIAHEVTGHLGVEGVIGPDGIKALTRKIALQKGGVWELAKKLGVFEDAEAAYVADIKSGKTHDEALESAVSEMIAHTEEQRPTKDFAAKFNEWLKSLVGALRNGLRRFGLNLDISTTDMYRLLSNARSSFNEVTPGAYKAANGDIKFRSHAEYNSAFSGIGDDVNKIVAKQKPWQDTVKGAANGLLFRTKYIDRFAPVEKIAEKIKDSLQATQLMYFLRMHDQRLNWTAQVASNGAIDFVEKKRKDGFIERVLETKEGANLKNIAGILRDADVGNPQAANELFTFYLAALRAKRVGLEKLNFDKSVTPALLNKVMTQIEANPKTKQAFEKARKEYNEYNKGLVNFAVKTGAIAKADAKVMLDSEDYIPFYRAAPNGEIHLEIGGAPIIKIGNLKDQPYLHELIGGDTAILDFFTSSLQNTNLLTDMALRNMATRNVAFSLNDLSLLQMRTDKEGKPILKGGIRDGSGPADPKVIRFKINGEDKHAIVDTEAAGVPAELLVKGLEGVKTSIPELVRYMGAPATLLRKFVTRNPAYALRQVVRDSLAATMVSGSNSAPLVGAFGELSKMVRGASEGEYLLQRRGILGGQVLTGTSEDMKQIMLQLTSGKAGWATAMAKLDSLAIKGDAASRVTMYNSFLKQGLSEMEATLATLESMNFSKRGISPSVFMANQLIPFLNAQIQGLDVLYKAFSGKMPFNEKLKIKEKLIKRGLMMAGMTLAYAALMQDDDAYQNASPADKYSNWFVYVPGADEPLKVPIPFELGLIFKALPEAVANTLFGDEKLKDSASAIGNLVWQSVPGSYPTAIKPLIEVYMNKSFYTGQDIENQHLQSVEASERYTPQTSEIAKLLGKATGVVGLSPVKLEYLVRGYTGSFPLAIASLANPVLSSDTGEKPEGKTSELPFVGSLFQAKDATGLINKAYNEMDNIVKTKQTYNKMLEEGRDEEADAYLDANADMIGMASFAGIFRQRMGQLTKYERSIRADQTMSAAQKRAELDAIRQDKIALAKELSSSTK